MPKAAVPVAAQRLQPYGPFDNPFGPKVITHVSDTAIEPASGDPLLCILGHDSPLARAVLSGQSPKARKGAPLWRPGLSAKERAEP